MSLKEKKYEKALNAMMVLGICAAFNYTNEEAEDVCICNDTLKQYYYELKQWIDDENALLESFPKKISDAVKTSYQQKTHEETMFCNMFKNVDDYPSIADLRK